LDEIKLDYKIVNSRIYDVVFEERKESNPCSLCAKLRRGILNTEAKKLGCNKIALGHTADDLDETFFLSLFYEGRLSTFSPVSYLTQVDITVIRPMIYVDESSTTAFASDKPVVHNCCPADKNTKRQFVKNLIEDLSIKIPNSKRRIHDALIHTERVNLIKPIEKYQKQHDEEKAKKQLMKATKSSANK
ncbi:MAG: ATP-binding protein, partial [Christensenellales bacterium]